MNFLSPFAFWFVAAIPVVVLFYLLKRKRVVHLVSSTLLWQKYLAEMQASAPFQRLRHNWLLLFQILLLLLVVLALSRPYFATKASTRQLKVIILDASGSMQSTDETPSRFEKARSEALKWVDSLRDNDQMVILQAAGTTEVKQSPTGEKAALRRALQSCRVTDGSTRLAEAFKLAESLVKDRPDAEIHLFSDGAIPNLGEFENKNLPLVYHQVGQRRNNLGIVSLDVRANPEDPNQRALFVSIVNHTTNSVSAELELRFDDQVVEVRPLTLAPTNTSPQVFVVSQPTNGVFSVMLSAKDDLMMDNQASIVSMLPQPARILLVTKGNRFLEKALRAAPNVELFKASDVVESEPGFDLVVLDDVTPTVWPERNVLAIHTLRTNWFSEWSRLEAPVIVAWRNTDPRLRFVNFDNVQIAETLLVKTPVWSTALVEASQTPLILAGELGRERILWIGFDTLQSTWPLRVSFPIFVANAVEWLNPNSVAANQMLVRAGEPFRFELSQPASTVRVVLPDQTSKAVPVETNSLGVVFSDTQKQGVYTVETGTNRFVFCVNAIDPAESDNAPRSELPFGRYGKVSATTLRRANMELWRFIAVAGLAVLMFEWWYYHRRTA